MTISWIIMITLAVLMLQNWIYQKRGFKHLQYRRQFNVKHAFAGDEVELVEHIENRKLLPLPWVRLEASISVGLQFGQQAEMDISQGQFFQNHRSLFSLGPYKRIIRRHRVVCAKRGLYRLNSVSLTCGDVFGIQARSQSLNLDVELLVYPEIIELQDIPLPSHSWLGDMVVRRWIVNDPFMIQGVREYRSGDSMKNVNWKATARTGHLQVHNHDYTANHRLMILINFEVTEKMWSAVLDPNLVEQAISYAASISQFMVLSGQETGFGCNGYSIDGPKEPVIVPSALGREHLTRIYEEMARLVIAVSNDFPTFLENQIVNETKEPTDFLIITAFVSDKMQVHLDKLRQQGHGVEIMMLHKDQGGDMNEDATTPDEQVASRYA